MNSNVKKLMEYILALDSSEVILFPGTFDPWHKGHSACLNLVTKNLPIIIIPDRNPEKSTTLTDLTEIKEIVRSHKNRYLFSEFLNSSQDNPTYYWYQSLKDELNHIKIHLLMGFDAFKSIDKWIEGTKLIHAIDSVLVVARMNQAHDFELNLKKYQKIAKNFTAEFLGHHPFEHESSSNIKKGS